MKERLKRDRNNRRLAIIKEAWRVWPVLFVLFLLPACQSEREHDHNQEEAIYTCPMHPEVVKDQPGSCPVCGMDLVKKESAPTSSSSVYTCPMHPEIVRNEPGACPVCGMDLVKKAEAKPANTADQVDLNTLLKPTYSQVISSVATTTPQRKTIPLVYQAPGYISYDPRNQYTVAARFGGRVEKLYVKYAFQKIQKGQKIMDIYSPALVTEQQNLIFLLNNDPGAIDLMEASKKHLRLLGLSLVQINRIIESRKADYTLSIYSPYSGYALPLSSAAAPNNSMPFAIQNSTEVELPLREGRYVQKGEALFNVNNAHDVWAILKIYPEDMGKVKVGQSVAIVLESQPEDTISGSIDFVEPFIEENARRINARVYLKNPDELLKVGSLLEAHVTGDNRKSLVVPRTSVYDLGMNKIVWQKEGNAFIARKVETGIVNEEWIEITGGLSESSRIALNAQFLVDSESFIKVNQNL